MTRVQNAGPVLGLLNAVLNERGFSVTGDGFPRAWVAWDYGNDDQPVLAVGNYLDAFMARAAVLREMNAKYSVPFCHGGVSIGTVWDLMSIDRWAAVLRFLETKKES